jgi:hypothetical protein
LVPTLADFECAIRHEQNRTSTSKNRHSCPASTEQRKYFCARGWTGFGDLPVVSGRSQFFDGTAKRFDDE